MAGTTIAYVLMFVVLALVGLLMFSPAFGVGDQFTNLIESIPGYVQTIAGWGNDLYTRYADVLQNDTVQTWINNALDAIVSWASTFARDSANGVVAIGTGLVNTFVALGFALVVAFWILMELPQLGRECMRLVNPKRHEDLEMLHVTFTRVMGGYIKGTLLQCAIIGAGCVVLFGAIGIPNYAALGGIAGLLNIIPIAGPRLGGALAAIVGVFVSPWIAVIALGGTIAIQQYRLYVYFAEDHGELGGRSSGAHPHRRTDGGLRYRLALISRLRRARLRARRLPFPPSRSRSRFSCDHFEKRTGRQLVSADGVFFQGTTASDGTLDPIADATSPHPDISAAFERVEQRKAEADQKAQHREKR